MTTLLFRPPCYSDLFYQPRGWSHKQNFPIEDFTINLPTSVWKASVGLAPSCRGVNMNTLSERLVADVSISFGSSSDGKRCSLNDLKKQIDMSTTNPQTNNKP